jgi:hypothetical protein
MVLGLICKRHKKIDFVKNKNNTIKVILTLISTTKSL